MDKWHGMTMEDIRALEEKTKLELDEERAKVIILYFYFRNGKVDQQDQKVYKFNID